MEYNGKKITFIQQAYWLILFILFKKPIPENLLVKENFIEEKDDNDEYISLTETGELKEWLDKQNNNVKFVYVSVMKVLIKFFNEDLNNMKMYDIDLNNMDIDDIDIYSYIRMYYNNCNRRNIIRRLFYDILYKIF